MITDATGIPLAATLRAVGGRPGALEHQPDHAGSAPVERHPVHPAAAGRAAGAGQARQSPASPGRGTGRPGLRPRQVPPPGLGPRGEASDRSPWLRPRLWPGHWFRSTHPLGPSMNRRRRVDNTTPATHLRRTTLFDDGRGLPPTCTPPTHRARFTESESGPVKVLAQLSCRVPAPLWLDIKEGNGRRGWGKYSAKTGEYGPPLLPVLRVDPV